MRDSSVTDLRRRPCGEARTRHRRSEKAVGGVPSPNARKNLAIFGDLRVVEASIEMSLVRRAEGGIELFIEEKWDGNVPQAMVPLVGRLDESSLCDARNWDPLHVDGVQHNTAGCV